MNATYVLAPQAALDLVEIWRYLREESNSVVANRVESVILERLAFLARSPGVGHAREDLTEMKVRFFPVYSYLIVYRPQTDPLEIVAILHGRRDVQEVLRNRI